MHSQLKSRIAGIRDVQMGHHAAGQGLASATIGTEREFLLREYLAKVLPPQFRFGSGVIIDTYGNKSGQLDVVVEWPFLPSFPTPAAAERLYLAESVAFVIEVKSNLSEKWPEVRSKTRDIFRLRRKLGVMMTQRAGGFTMGAARDSSIPVVAIGYKGYASAESLKRAVLDTPGEERPNVALVIESGAYFNRVGGEKSFSGEAGLFALCADVAAFARNVIAADPQLDSYLVSPAG